MKTISDRIFEILEKKKMSQKAFAEATGIAESSISDWKRKRTNPTADKILIICEVLNVSPYELLSGAEQIGDRSRRNQIFVVDKNTEEGLMLESYQNLSRTSQMRLLGYMNALLDNQAEEE